MRLPTTGADVATASRAGSRAVDRRCTRSCTASSSRAAGPGPQHSCCGCANSQLDDAVLPRTDLRGADLSRAELGSVLEPGSGGAILTSADLRGAKLRGTYFSGAVLSGADLRDEDLSQDRLDDADLGVRTAPARESGARARCSDTVRLREARPRASPRGDAPSRAVGRRPSALGRPARRGPAQRNLDQREAPGGGAARREPARRRPAAGERRGCCGHARHAVSPAKRAMPEGPARALGTGKTSMSATRTAVPPNRTALTLEFAPRPRAHLISQAHPPRHAARHVLEDLNAIRTWLIPVRCGARSWRAARRADAVTAR
jgi:uncharacterized protein YjbI with pentapeptide repeats